MQLIAKGILLNVQDMTKKTKLGEQFQVRQAWIMADGKRPNVVDMDTRKNTPLPVGKPVEIPVYVSQRKGTDGKTYVSLKEA